jgi:rsbT antagonist protein RsbS
MEDDKTSVIKVRDILMVTIPPDLEDATITTLQEKVLQAMERYCVKGLIMDISMVDTLDSYFARLITETAQMINIMGGQTVVVGMRPSVAITTVHLGLNLKNIVTTLNVDRALGLFENYGREAP